MKAIAMGPKAVQKFLRAEVQAVLVARVAHQIEAEAADVRYNTILAAGNYLDEDGNRVLNHKLAYKIADEDHAKEFFSLCDKATAKAGYKLAAGYCPALIAETAKMKAERALVDKAGPLFDLTADQLFCTGFKKYDEFIELTIGLVLAKR